MKHNTRMAIVMIEAFVFALLFGCTHLTPQTKQTIEQDQQQSAIDTAKVEDQSAIDIAKEKAKDALSQIQGENSPIAHPIEATNNLVVKLRKPLIVAVVLFGFLWALEFGLSFTSFNILSPFAPVFRWLAILSLAALIALPFLPLGVAIIGGAFLGLLIYELVRDHGNVKQAVADTESTLGFGTPASSPAPAVGSAKPAPLPASASTASAA